MSERDNAHGHKTHRSDSLQTTHTNVALNYLEDHEPFCQGTREKNSRFAISTIRGRVSQDGETCIT